MLFQGIKSHCVTIPAFKTHSSQSSFGRLAEFQRWRQHFSQHFEENASGICVTDARVDEPASGRKSMKQEVEKHMFNGSGAGPSYLE